jgi:hypothetical protein
MRKLGSALAAAAVAALMAAPAMAGHGGVHLSGSHYNLNVIGVERGKNADLTGSKRHTIFVELDRQGNKPANNIWLEPTTTSDKNDFEVCDGNATATDTGAYSCDGSEIKNAGAVFRLPCNTNLDGSGVDVFGCEVDNIVDLSYSVWARALTPHGSADITTCATETEDVDNKGGSTDYLCSTESAMLIKIKKNPWVDVTDELTSICVNTDDDPACEERYALFRHEFEDWTWEYDNNGLKLAQIRFYEN